VVQKKRTIPRRNTSRKNIPGLRRIVRDCRLVPSGQQLQLIRKLQLDDRNVGGSGPNVCRIGGLIIWENHGGRSSVDYYLTNYRLVETKAGRVVGQVPRKLFKGEPTARFLAQDSSYDQGGTPVYNVSVHDPESGDVLMRLNDMPKESVESLAELGGVTYCEHCGRGNTPSQRTCQSCGATL